MLDQSLLNDFNHVVGATTDSAEVHKDSGEVLQREVTVQTLIDELLLHKFPELVVLQVAIAGTLNCAVEGLGRLAVQSGQLLLHHGHNDVPEVGALFKLCLQDEVETKHDLLRGHVLLAELLVDEADVLRVLCVDQREVDLVEDH